MPHKHGVRMGVLCDCTGQIVDECQTVGEVGLKQTDVLTLQVRRQTVVARSELGFSFAAVLGDGSVVTWPDPSYGGDSRRVKKQLKNVQYIQATDRAFAAVLDTGCVVTWGDPHCGGDCSAVQEQLRRVRYIQAAELAFAAMLDTGCAVTWGDPRCGGDSTTVQERLTKVRHIQATPSAFAAVLDD